MGAQHLRATNGGSRHLYDDAGSNELDAAGAPHSEDQPRLESMIAWPTKKLAALQTRREDGL